MKSLKNSLKASCRTCTITNAPSSYLWTNGHLMSVAVIVAYWEFPFAAKLAPKSHHGN